MKYFFILISIWGFTSCNNKQNEPVNGTPVSGNFTIYCDETYYSLVSVLAEGYMAIYPQVVVSIDSSQTSNAYSKLSDITIRSAVTGFPLTSADSLALNQRNIFPQVFHFATDAIALVYKKQADTTLKYNFKLSEKICLNELVRPLCNTFITDRPGSENTRQLQVVLSSKDSCAGSLFSSGNQNAILKRVSEFDNEIGIVGWSNLSEKRNPIVIEWRSKLTIVPFETDSGKLIYPTQSALMTGEYPMTRKLYLVTSEPYAGPATGFAAYVASDEGQRIIRLFGLAPYKTPPREIYVN